MEGEYGLKPVRRYMDPNASWNKAAINDGVALVDLYQAEGFMFEKWPSLKMQAKDAGVDKVREGLSNGGVVIFERCKSMIMELQSWSYKRNTQGERPPGDEQYQDTMNDLMDGLIAAEVMGYHWSGETPVPETQLPLELQLLGQDQDMY